MGSVQLYTTVSVAFVDYEALQAKFYKLNIEAVKNKGHKFYCVVFFRAHFLPWFGLSTLAPDVHYQSKEK